MNPRVLMLGWEYPPYINGGLGIATTGLAAALGEITPLQLIVPRAQVDLNPHAFDLIGLNQQKKRWVSQKKYRDKIIEEKLRKVKLSYVNVDLQGYEIEPKILRKSIQTESFFTVKRVVREAYVEKVEVVEEQEGFQLSQNYGKNLIEKVTEYGEWVREIVRDQDFDLIHAHDWMTFLAGLELKALYDKPLVLHIHSLTYDRQGPEARGWVYELERHAMNQADIVLPVSRYTANVITQYYGISPHKLSPVYNGIAPQEPYRTPKPFKERLVVFLGRITGQKGPEYFYQAAKKLLVRDPNVRFVVAGKGDLIDPMIRQTAKDRLGDRIHFTGFMEPDRVTDMLSMADLYIMPSVSEPFGLSALEAAQMDVPCIISETSGVAEVLPHAIQVDYAKTDTMARMMYALLHDREWRHRITQGQQADLKHLTWTKSAKEVMRIYQQLFNQDAATRAAQPA
ncbi:MAG: glycosyltransferase [Bacteroidota bacterium]